MFFFRKLQFYCVWRLLINLRCSLFGISVFHSRPLYIYLVNEYFNVSGATRDYCFEMGNMSRVTIFYYL